MAAAASPALADPMYHHTYDWGYASFTMGAGSHPKTEAAYKKPEPAYRCVLFLLVSCSFSVTNDDKQYHECLVVAKCFLRLLLCYFS